MDFRAIHLILLPTLAFPLTPVAAGSLESACPRVVRRVLRQLEASKSVLNLSGSPRAWQELVNRFTGSQKLVGLLDSQAHTSIRIEVGPGENPICSNCIPVDARDVGTVARQGVVADARALPFKSQSVSLIVSKSFSWFQTSRYPEYFKSELVLEKTLLIEDVLKEYRRVLTNDGAILLLVNSDSKEDAGVSFAKHSALASQLGFDVTTVTPVVSGTYIGPRYGEIFPRPMIKPELYEKLQNEILAAQRVEDQVLRERKTFIAGIVLTRHGSEGSRVLRAP